MNSTRFCVIVALTILALVLSVKADVTVVGDVTPAPGDSFWSTGGDYSTRVDVGVSGDVSVNGGSELGTGYTVISSGGRLTLDGSGSTWQNFATDLTVGGMLNITDGGQMVSHWGTRTNVSGVVTVEGVGSILQNWEQFAMFGVMNIFNHGLVVADRFVIDWEDNEDNHVNMATGGTLVAHDTVQYGESFISFYHMVTSTDVIRYWDDSTSDWASLAGATIGEDYTINLDPGTNYYTLTVTAPVPEPATMSLLALSGVMLLRRRRG